MVSDRKSQSIITFLLLLMLIIAFLAYQNHVSYTKLKSAFIDEKQEIEAELDRMIIDYDEALTQKTKASVKLKIERKRVIRLRDTVKNLQENSYNLLRKFRKRISFLEAQNKELFVKVDSLNNVNTHLRDENLVVKKELSKKTLLTKKLSDYSNDLEHSKKDLENTIAKAKVLEIKNFNVIPMRKRNNGKYTSTLRRRRIEAFKISLDIEKNELAEIGKRKVYIQVIDTDKNVVSVDGHTTLKDDSQIAYTDVFTTNYQKKEVALVSFVEIEKGKVKKGKYTINAYLEGKLVGNKLLEI